MFIIHAVIKEDWEKISDKEYYGDEYLKECGFIHCSDINTYHLVAPNFKEEQRSMLILLIDTSKVEAEIRFEDLYNGGLDFPHIYGLLNKSAVTMVLPHLWDNNKNWVMNEELLEIEKNNLKY